jgi:hypothetical protein
VSVRFDAGAKEEGEARPPVLGRRAPSVSVDSHRGHPSAEAMVGYGHVKIDLSEEDGSFPNGAVLIGVLATNPIHFRIDGFNRFIMTIMENLPRRSVRLRNSIPVEL